ncbi:FadR/GntR family transcriptional regulator [Lysinibacter cavernae]|uniref:DNA-binding FadR family transcriptional regulator n=2 Tax=Lysinibacter cavernae TaxID=1640652 RepID=A0A7X5TTB1_9MICO|nr:DNA-binding FadR family transcriptional regulator [Lysinibacter cavernae]
MTAIRRNPLADQVAQSLAARLAAGEWPLGQKLPGETTLAAQLEVGRSTVREAIRELSGKGMLESRQGSGVFVTALEPNDDVEASLRAADILMVIEARIAIEAEAARLAAQRRTPSDLRAITKALADRGDADSAATPSGSTVETYVDIDMAFHRAVIRASHNPVLEDLFDAFLPRLRPAMIAMLRLQPTKDLPADHASHAAIAAAIRERRADEAAAASRIHLSHLQARFA